VPTPQLGAVFRLREEGAGGGDDSLQRADPRAGAEMLSLPHPVPGVAAVDLGEALEQPDPGDAGCPSRGNLGKPF
jgi:hypothetical protein